MPDNWGFVAAAYGLTAAVLLWYWRRLAKQERELERVNTGSETTVAERSREPSKTGHPRPEPSPRTPLQ